MAAVDAELAERRRLEDAQEKLVQKREALETAAQERKDKDNELSEITKQYVEKLDETSKKKREVAKKEKELDDKNKQLSEYEEQLKEIFKVRRALHKDARMCVRIAGL